MVKSTKQYSELFNITSDIQYNRPYYTNCPVCTCPKTLFVLFNKNDVWAYCQDCHTCGTAKDWFSYAEKDTLPDNFYQRANDILYKYSDKIAKDELTLVQKKLLERIGYTCPGYHTRYPVIGITIKSEFDKALLHIKEKLGNRRWKEDKHHCIEKSSDPVVFIPIYSTLFKIAGFTVTNGYNWEHYHHGNLDTLHYRQGKYFNKRKYLYLSR